VVLSGKEADAELRRLAKARDRAQRQGGPHPWRWRWQVVPLAWPVLIGATLAARAAGADWVSAGAVAAVPCGVAALLVRHRDAYTRAHVQASAAWAWLWAMLSAGLGLGPWSVVGLAGWAVPYGYWLAHYAWRPPGPEAKPDQTVEQTFAELCETQKWHASLGPAAPIPGGQQWPIRCRGTKTHIDQICKRPEALAAAFDAAVDEAYAEPARNGVKSMGTFTRLRQGTLSGVRPWDGATIDPATGLAVVGRFPDGQPVRCQVYRPGVGGGARHDLIAGVDGSGKTGALNLGLCISAVSGLVAPVILDPQMGQALPAWRDHVPYAKGPDECTAYLEGLFDGMQAQSAWLADKVWTNPVTGRTIRGMDFFDPVLCGLPLVEVTVDEAPLLLADKPTAKLVLKLAKLGRKVGVRLRLALQVPSIAEFGNVSEIRSILAGGNVFCYRTADSVTSGMVRLSADPGLLAREFRDGSPTVGLGYAIGPDNRPSVPMRTDFERDVHGVAERAARDGLIRPLPSLIAEGLAARLNRPSAEVLAERAEAQAQDVLGVLGARTMTIRELLAEAGCKPSDVAHLVREGKLARDGETVRVP